MNKQLKHSPTTILNKAFHVDFKGYSPFEVDLLLDEIMEDYRTMALIQKAYQEEIAQLQARNVQFQERLVQLESQLATLKGTPSNSDVLKRLARLEALLDQQD